MSLLDTLSQLPQFVRADTPRSLYNLLSNCLLTERIDSEGLILQSGSLIVTLEGDSLSKYISAVGLQARMLESARDS